MILWFFYFSISIFHPLHCVSFASQECCQVTHTLSLAPVRLQLVSHQLLGKKGKSKLSKNITLRTDSSFNAVKCFYIPLLHEGASCNVFNDSDFIHSVQNWTLAGTSETDLHWLFLPFETTAEPFKTYK